MYSYPLNKVCSTKVDFNIKDGKIEDVVFYGGCPGNLQAVAKLIQNMPVDETIDKLSGICCGSKDTSCADQLAKVLLHVRNLE